MIDRCRVKNQNSNQKTKTKKEQILCKKQYFLQHYNNCAFKWSCSELTRDKNKSQFKKKNNQIVSKKRWKNVKEGNDN